MTVGSTLLKLQELDLALERDQAALDGMPEIAQLAKKRKAYLKLKADANKLLAARKDLENDLADLDEDEAFCNAAIDQAQSEMQKSENHRLMKDFEQQLAGIAKSSTRSTSPARRRSQRLRRPSPTRRMPLSTLLSSRRL